jgi:hypothetical protein
MFSAIRDDNMKRMLCFALSWAAICLQPPVLEAGGGQICCAPKQPAGSPSPDQPGVVSGVVLDVGGIITGKVTSSSGKPVSDITMRVIDAGGTVSGHADVKDGDFSIPGVAYGTYTLLCVDRGKGIGTASVTVSAPSQSVNLVCNPETVFWKKPGLLTGLGAAATAIGAAGVVVRKADASSAR